MLLPRTKFYAITDAQISGLSHVEQVKRLADGGARLIQLREKQSSPREFFNQAEESVAEARKRGLRIIINDRADIALAVGADGIHLGQDDLPAENVRQMLGELTIIGLSTHNSEQAKRATQLPIDYLAIGPLYPTSTKKDPDPPIGVDGLRKVREVVGDIPLVAIGGISLETAAEVLAAGADMVAVIGAVLSNPATIESVTAQLILALTASE